MKYCVLLFVFISALLIGHEEIAMTNNLFEGHPHTWIQWIGSFHLLFLHFPIVLIIMTAISEWLFASSHKPLYDAAANFMLVSAALFGIPTVILGYIYSNAFNYSGYLDDLLDWHAGFGVATALLAILTIFIRWRQGPKQLYYMCLAILVILVTITGYYGGEASFGTNILLPPL